MTWWPEPRTHGDPGCRNLVDFFTKKTVRLSQPEIKSKASASPQGFLSHCATLLSRLRIISTPSVLEFSSNVAIYDNDDDFRHPYWCCGGFQDNQPQNV